MEELKIKCSSSPDKWAKAQFILAHGAAKYIRKNLLDLDKLGEEFLKGLEVYSELRKYFFMFLEEENIKQLNIEDIDKIIKKYAIEEKLNIVKEIRTKCIWS